MRQHSSLLHPALEDTSQPRSFWCPPLHNCRDALNDSHNGSQTFFFLPSMSLGSCKSLKTCTSFGLSCRVSVFLQLQKRKEREEQLEDVIQAYEKIHMEKSNLQRDLDKMVRHLSAHHVTLIAKNQPLMRAK